MEYPINRLYCSDCKCFRLITQFPFGLNHFRLGTCLLCRARRRNRDESNRNQCDRDQSDRDQSNRDESNRDQSDRDESSQNQQEYNARLRYCSGCNQLRQPSQFTKFRTCEICRKINTKAQRRRVQQGQQSNSQQQSDYLRHQAEVHLRQWVQQSGEQELKSQKYYPLPPLNEHKRRPLTVDDYLQEIEPQEQEQLLKQQEERRQQRQQRQKRLRIIQQEQEE
jgi:hypothetical protein